MGASRSVTRVGGALLVAGLVLLVSGLGEAEDSRDGALVVRVSGVRSATGKVWVHLWDRPDGFPTAGKKARSRREVPIRGGTAEAIFEGLPRGTYAVFAFHDEDGDGRVRTNLLGMPTEGVGASNGARGRTGPPSFRAASFEIAAARRSIEIRLLYL